MINLLHFLEIDHPDYHHVFHTMKPTGRYLTGHLAMCFLELPKLRETNVLPKRALAP